ncbi:hypothetical protein BDW22DRAFT_874170 [Trametopsis cervina]|nr:hypothetical protein BDW22DRAFT_874170 [Trametopsis cervina]
MLVGPCARSLCASCTPSGFLPRSARHCVQALPGLLYQYGALRSVCPISLSPSWNPTTANTQHAPCRLWKNHADVIVLLFPPPDSLPRGHSPMVDVAR